ncbi:MAG: fumarate hydratase C-terminal domain-containing protein [Thermoplasmata archaeon]|nr:fumarate hydratase C-terminal domain-containing protein [Thermoplasmata archaeon]
MEHRIKLPIDDVRFIHAGDIIYIDGLIFTARDMAHKRMMKEKPPFDISGSAIYHCGPIARRNEEWEIIAAGPTTSMRMEPYEHEIIRKYGARIIIGKGGMGSRTAQACREHGAIYAVFTGGAAVLAASKMKRVKAIAWEELGMADAMWAIEVENFGPMVVSIDAHGNNLMEEIRKKAIEKANIL